VQNLFRNDTKWVIIDFFINFVVMAAPKNNTNAQKWSLEQAIALFEKSIELAKRKTEYFVSGQLVLGFEFHYIGEIATSDEIELYPDIYLYFKNTFKDCEPLYKALIAQCEANCFSDTKRGIIKEATGIFNLKANHKWSERQEIDHTTNGENINTQPIWQVVDGKKK